MLNYELRHVPAKYHHLFSQAYSLIDAGDRKAAAELFNTFPSDLANYGATFHLADTIMGKALNADTRSLVERGETAIYEQNPVAQMFPAASPLELAQHGVNVAPDAPAESMAERSSMALQQQRNAQPLRLADGEFDRFHAERTAATQADNARMERLAAPAVHLRPASSIVEQTGEAFTDGAEYGREFAAGLEAARVADFSGQPWSDPTPYQPAAQQSDPEPDLSRSDLGWMKRFRLAAA